jgi:ABC-type nitrate/sulfonate/bicarbonate transport system substrate-binding protein
MNLALRLAVCALTFAAFARAASADDTLTVVGGSTATGFFEVVDIVAQQAGFFKEQHLIVDKQYSGNSSLAAQLVASNKADIASFAMEPILSGYEKGLRLVGFFSRDPQYVQTLAVLDGSPIRTLAGFKGAAIGEYSVGSAAEIPANSELAGAGVRRGDYTYIPIGSGAQAISALTSGKVAGVAFPYPELVTYATFAGLKFRYFWHPILKDIPASAYAASPATIAAKGDQLRRFARALVEASILIRVNPQLAARYFVAGSGGQITSDAVAREARLLAVSQDMLPGIDPASRTIGELPLRSTAVLTTFMADNGLTAHVIPAAAIVTDQFIPYANDFDHQAFIARMRTLR